MALTTEQYVSIYAPTYVGNANLALYIQAAQGRINTSFWGTLYSEAVALQACHMIALATDPARANGTAGAISHKSEGKLSVSFSTGGGASGDWGSTSFGQQLLRLQMSCGPAAFVTGQT